MFFNNDFRLLSIYGGPEWTLSTAAGTIKFGKQVKATEFLVVSRSYVWSGWLKANEFEFRHKRCKIIRLWRKMRFFYTQALSNPEVSKINKKKNKKKKNRGIWPRLMRPLTLQNHLC